MSVKENTIAFLIDLVSTKYVVTAGLAGAASYLMPEASVSNAVKFGAVTALASSVSDTLLTIGGYNMKIDSYLPNDYVDPSDFVGTAAAYYALEAAGLEAPSMSYVAVAGLAAGIAPKIALYVQKKIAAQVAAAVAAELSGFFNKNKTSVNN